MSETSTAVEPSHGHALLEGHSDLPMLPGEEHPHPSPFQYVMIAVVLCVITALEIGAYYLDKAVPKGALERQLARLERTRRERDASAVAAALEVGVSGVSARTLVAALALGGGNRARTWQRHKRSGAAIASTSCKHTRSRRS